MRVESHLLRGIDVSRCQNSTNGTAASDTNKTESQYLLGLVDSIEYEIKQESPIEIYFMYESEISLNQHL
jgi:hypothetical protein